MNLDLSLPRRDPPPIEIILTGCVTGSSLCFDCYILDQAKLNDICL